MCFSKFILFTTNVILFVIGMIVVAISSAIIHKGGEYGELLLQGIFALPVIVLTLGVFISLLGFLGCFGALRESKLMLYAYGSIVLVLFVGEVVLAILLISDPDGLKGAFKTALRSQFMQYENDWPTQKAIDELQQNLHCCGVDGPEDWNHSGLKGALPWSCCEDAIENTDCQNSSSTVYREGCYDSIMNAFNSIIVTLGIAALVLAGFMFFSMSTACGLARKH